MVIAIRSAMGSGLACSLRVIGDSIATLLILQQILVSERYIAPGAAIRWTADLDRAVDAKFARPRDVSTTAAASLRRFVTELREFACAGVATCLDFAIGGLGFGS
jgi:hypothetical protein